VGVELTDAGAVGVPDGDDVGVDVLDAVDVGDKVADALVVKVMLALGETEDDTVCVRDGSAVADPDGCGVWLAVGDTDPVVVAEGVDVADSLKDTVAEQLEVADVDVDGDGVGDGDDDDVDDGDGLAVPVGDEVAVRDSATMSSVVTTVQLASSVDAAVRRASNVML
jgi:hypothetical protein